MSYNYKDTQSGAVSGIGLGLLQSTANAYPAPPKQTDGQVGIELGQLGMTIANLEDELHILSSALSSVTLSYPRDANKAIKEATPTPMSSPVAVEIRNCRIKLADLHDYARSLRGALDL